MTTITQDITDIAGADDNTAWTFYVKQIRLSDAGDSIISTKKVRKYPVAGVLTVELDPGPAVVLAADGKTYPFTVPETDSELWPLIEASVGMPPGTTKGDQGDSLESIRRVGDTIVGTVNGVDIPNPVNIGDLLFNPAINVYFVDAQPGADPTGVAFSDAAVAAARTALGTDPGVIVFGAGYYKCANVIEPFGAGQGIVAYGAGSTALTFTGTGDFIRIQDPDSAGVQAGAAGPCHGFTIDGFSAGNNSSGIHAGDITMLRIADVYIRYFNNPGCVGLWMDDVLSWTERANIEAVIDACTTQVLFDVHGAYTSFAYNTFDFSIQALANQHGVVLRNGAQLYNTNMRIRGNFERGTGNTGIVLSVGTDNSAVAINGHLDIQVEAGAGGGTGIGHKTIQVGTAADIHGTGILQFNNAGVAFENGNAAASGKFHFFGQVNVDGELGRMANFGVAASVGGVTTQSVGAAAGGDIYLNSGNYFAWQIGNGATTITFHNDIMEGWLNAFTVDLFIQQPASGAAGTLTWPVNVTWLGGAPVLSTANNAVDHIRLIAPNGSGVYGYYGQHVSRTVNGVTHSAASKSVPVDADEIPLVDTAAGNALKKLTIGNLKTAVALTNVQIAPALYDSFTAADGTALDSGKWTVTTGGAAAAAVTTNTNRARFTAGATGGYADADRAFAVSTLATSLADAEFLVRHTFGNPSVEAYMSYALRSSATDPRTNSYTFMLGQPGDSFWLDKYVAGVKTTLTSGVITSFGCAAAVAGSIKWVRLRVKGTTVAFKIWDDGTLEPTAWSYSTTDSSVTAGGRVVAAIGGGSAASSGVNYVDQAHIYAL